MKLKSMRTYIKVCEKNQVVPTLKGLKLWSKICR